MATTIEVLEALNFGQDVSENEVNLDKYFLETEAFKSVVGGEVDLVMGHKGTGKSAIYRILVSEKYDIPTLKNTYVLPASNPTGSDIFRQILGTDKTEVEFRLLWTAYLVSLVGNHVCDTFADQSSGKIKEINEFLVAIGLRTQKANQQSLLSRIKNLRRINFSVGTSMDGMPTIGFEIDLGEKKDSKTEVPESAFCELFEMLVDIFNEADSNCWIVMDRLDEAFSRNSDEELLALRGLLRAHMQLCALSGGQVTIRPKLFLRTDIFDRITRIGGFTNVTHFRSINLMWNQRSIASMVAQRILCNDMIAGWLKLNGVNLSDSNAVWQAIIPGTIQSDKSLKWVVSGTCDGLGAYNPRNVLTLLSLARIRGLNLIKSNPDYSLRNVISTEAIQSAFGELSRRRLDDTILAEFPEARPYVERLRGGAAIFSTRRELWNVLTGNDGSVYVPEIVDHLFFIGLLKSIDADQSSVAFLYRPALKTTGKGTGTIM